MILPDSMRDMPSGVLIYLDNEGQWVMALNRVVKKVLDDNGYAELLSEAKEFLREARRHGHDVVDEDDEYEIRNRLPKVGDSVPQLEARTRVLEGGLEEAATILPHLWDWIVGIANDPWEPDDNNK